MDIRPQCRRWFASPCSEKLLLDFEKNNPDITLEPWGLEELRQIFRHLSLEDLESWFGPAPTEETELGFKNLQPVLERIATQASPPVQSIREVPRGKIEANALSESVATLLKAGMAKAPLVEEFFAKWRDPDFGERSAESFRKQYESLYEKFTPNRIFSELQGWAGGSARGAPEHELAVLSVLAYYFERCDIFEEPRESRNIQ
uniref:ABC-three component systems C-terminal domain-containing protein n=1 Tax=Candidatus Kentrum sp. MB TaxID=2138164 RepID=A0A450XI32_9GAMM|nr:MAG: hypothetical protein BECKMB1821G_GA0114241_10439 [Candidatus Kentron sp. MB]VFK33410.1 MAG: hypothetical protein BECKMB1821I_GA0114274_10459 [Candidatus Kentron sp. MB]VFK76152.1 MAG: hypothetical protein BECKMB1821H_GA0114242_10449 [Candidatus Kentron sp. MB]